MAVLPNRWVVAPKWVAEEWLWVANSSVNSLLKSPIFRTSHINILRYISKTETRTNLCEVRITFIIIPIWFLLYSFNRSDCGNTASLEELSAAQWCWDYDTLVNICPFQIRLQLSSTDIFIFIIPQSIALIILYSLWFKVMIPVQSSV